MLSDFGLSNVDHFNNSKFSNEHWMKQIRNSLKQSNLTKKFKTFPFFEQVFVNMI